METLITSLLPWLLVGGVALAVIYFLGRRVITALWVLWAKVRLQADERVMWHQKVRLLEHPSVVEHVAPSKDFSYELGEEEKPKAPLFWLSPYPRALKLAYKRSSRGRRSVNAVELLKEAARAITVFELPEDRQPLNAGPEHFAVVVPLGDSTQEQVEALGGFIKAALALESLTVGLTEDRTAVEFVCHSVAVEDRLGATVVPVSWLEENPAQSWRQLPVAVAEDGEPVALTLHQTFLYGVSGSGKGSFIHAVVRQLSPFVREGSVKLFGVDTKNEDVGVYRDSRLFSGFVVAPEHLEAMVEFFYKKMTERAALRQQDLDNNQLGLRINLGKENPVHVLLWDEYVAALVEMSAQRSWKRTSAQLQAILTQGRSLGFFIVAAGQSFDNELFGRQRDLFVNGVSLRAAKSWWAEQVLGEGSPAAELAVAISASTPGVGFLRAGLDGDPQRVRFPFASDDDLLPLLKSWGSRKPGEASEFDAWRGQGAVAARTPQPVVALPTVKPLPAPVPPVAKPLPAAVARKAPTKPAKRNRSWAEPLVMDWWSVSERTPQNKALAKRFINTTSEEEFALMAQRFREQVAAARGMDLDDDGAEDDEWSVVELSDEELESER